MKDIDYINLLVSQNFTFATLSIILYCIYIIRVCVCADCVRNFELDG